MRGLLAALLLAPALAWPADLYRQHCATCHSLHGEGFPVGPDLTTVKTRGEDLLLIDILDPNRVIAPEYINYTVATRSGQIATGMIAAETSTTLTLRRAQGAEDVILRKDIEEIRGTGQSLMLEGLEKELKPQDVADVIKFLRTD